MLALLALVIPLAHAQAPAQVPYLNASDEYASGALGMSPYQTFVSSNSTPVRFNFVEFPQNADGHLFLAPRGKDVKKGGATIFNWDGELVWDGSEYGEAMSFAPFKYQDQDVIALWQGEFNSNGYGSGYGLVLDQSYSVVANVSTTVPGAKMDFHEFYITDNGTALITVYGVDGPTDLTAFGGPADGFIMVGYAQEIDIATGKALWTWKSLDHVDPSLGYASPGETGKAADNPWDYFHINSIEKDDKGNYLISARHTSAIYYVSGTDGSIIWTMGGKNSTIQMGENTSFSWQHDARFHDNNTISLFDNAGTDWAQNATSARGMLLRVENGAASLVSEMLPSNTTIAASQGNMDRLENGWIAGWGQNPWATGYAPDGTRQWSVQFGVGDVQSYRAHETKWVGYPKTNPSLVVNGTHGAVSWNGATEVTDWEVLVANNSVSTVKRTGFETIFEVNATNGVQVRAVGQNGTLGFSSVVGSDGSSSPPSQEQSGSVSTPAASFTTGAAAAAATSDVAGQPESGAVKIGVSVVCVVTAALACLI